MQNYTLVKRTVSHTVTNTKGEKITKSSLRWYVKFKNNYTGEYGSLISVEGLLKKLGEPSPVTMTKPMAKHIVENALEYGFIENSGKIKTDSTSSHERKIANMFTSLLLTVK